MRVGGWQLRSFMDLTCTSWGDAKDGFEERTVTFAKSECLTSDSDKKKPVNCALSDTVRVGIISQNHTHENGNLRPSSYWCVFGVAAHVGRTPGTRVSETQADQLLVIRPVPEISLSTRTAGRQRLAVEQSLIVQSQKWEKFRSYHRPTF